MWRGEAVLGRVVELAGPGRVVRTAVVARGGTAPHPEGSLGRARCRARHRQGRCRPGRRTPHKKRAWWSGHRAGTRNVRPTVLRGLRSEGAGGAADVLGAQHHEHRRHVEGRAAIHDLQPSRICAQRSPPTRWTVSGSVVHRDATRTMRAAAVLHRAPAMWPGSREGGSCTVCPVRRPDPGHACGSGCVRSHRHVAAWRVTSDTSGPCGRPCRRSA
jgi:hypothetical protein